MIAREYLLRQAMTLLRLSKAVHDPNTSAALAVKAADLKARGDDMPALDTSPPLPADAVARK
jgi:hypothetical protein